MWFFRKKKSNKNEVTKPIFIIGVPRSGTTLLYKILCRHPELAYFTSCDLKNIIPKKRQIQIIENWKKLKAKNEKIPHSEENFFAALTHKLKNGEKMNPVPIEAEIFWQKFFGQEYVNNISTNQRITLSNELSEFLESQKKIRFLNKAPQHCMRLFALKKTFPDAKFIHISRDPKQVIASSLVREKKEGKFNIGIKLKNEIPSRNYNLIEKWAWAYKDIIESINEFGCEQDKNRFMSVHYDELVKNPKQIISNILNFCELNTSSIEKMVPHIHDTSEKWKEILTTEDEQKIFKIISNYKNN